MSKAGKTPVKYCKVYFFSPLEPCCYNLSRNIFSIEQKTKKKKKNLSSYIRLKEKGKKIFDLIYKTFNFLKCFLYIFFQFNSLAKFKETHFESAKGSKH